MANVSKCIAVCLGIEHKYCYIKSFSFSFSFSFLFSSREIISYMEFVRHRVESIFTAPIRLLLKGCSIEARNRPRITKTGKCMCDKEDGNFEI